MAEMEDLLSYDEVVLDSVFQYHVPNVTRIPTHVWVRLRRSLRGLMGERHHGCLSWKHESLHAIAEQRYAEEKESSHRHLAEYFGNVIEESIKKEKKLNASPLLTAGTHVWLPSAIPNYRRCEETVGNFVHAEMLKEAVEHMCNMDFICVAFLCNEGNELVRCLELLLDKIRAKQLESDPIPLSPRDMNEDKSVDWQDMERTVMSYEAWLKQSVSRIEVNPRMFIPLTVTAEPLESIARADYIKTYYSLLLPELTYNEFQNEHCWIRGHCWPREYHLNSHLGQHCVRWANRGLSVVSAEGSTLKLWDLSSMTIERTMRTRDQKAIIHMELSPRGDRLITIAWDGSALMWNMEQGTSWCSIGDNVNITSVDWTHDGTEFVTGTSDKRVLLWKTQDCCQVRESVRLVSYASQVRCSPSGNHVAILTLSKHVNIWNLKTNDMKSYSMHNGQVQDISWCQDGKQIATASDDHKVIIWDVTDSSVAQTTFDSHKGPVKSVHWSASGKIVSGDSDGFIYVWSPIDKSIHHSWNAASVAILYVAWNMDSTKILAIPADGAVVIYDSLALTLQGPRSSRRKVQTR